MLRPILLWIALLVPSAVSGAPSIQWGAMIGGSTNAPAGFRKGDGKALDFTVIVAVIADAQTVDSVTLALTVDAAGGFSLPAGETQLKTAGPIAAGDTAHLFWHVAPPAVEGMYTRAVVVAGSYETGGATMVFPSIQRDIPVRQLLPTSQFSVVNNTVGNPLAGQQVEVYQTVTIDGGNPSYFAWGLFLSRYDCLSLTGISTTFPHGTGGSQTYLSNGGLADGDYRITYRFHIRRGNDTLSLHNQFYGLTGNWRGIDSEFAGVGFVKWVVYNQGFKGRLADCGDGTGLAGIPINLYSTGGTLVDSSVTSQSDGSYAFGIPDSGRFVLYFNDPSRPDHDPGYASLLADNAGAGYHLAFDSVITVNRCLARYNPAGTLHRLEIIPDTAVIFAGNTAVFQAAGYDAAGSRLPVSSLGTLTWSGGVSVGTITSAAGDLASFRADVPGTDSVSVTSSVGGITAVSGAVSVWNLWSGPLYRLEIVGAADSMGMGDSLELTVRGYDQWHTLLPADSLGTVTWSGGVSVGTYRTAAGTAAVFLATATGTDSFYVTSSRGITAWSSPVTVHLTPAFISRVVRLEISPAAAVATADSSLAFTVTGFDASDIPVPSWALAPYTVWSGGGTVGTLAGTAGLSTLLDLTTAGTGYVTVTDTLRGLSAVSGAISVTPGRVTAVRIENAAGLPDADRTLTTDDDGQRVYAAGYDTDGNRAGCVPVAWHLAGAVGTVMPDTAGSTAVTLTAPGSGRLTVWYGAGIADTGGVITVLPGRAASLAAGIPAAAAAGDSLLLTVTAQDADGNTTGDHGTLTWSAGVPITGSFSPNAAAAADTSLFIPVTAGTGPVRCLSSYGPADSALVVISPGAVSSIRITDPAGTETGTLTLSTDDDSLIFYAHGSDAFGNSTGTVPVSWSAGTCGLALPGSGDRTALFLSLPGTGQLTAVYAPGIADSTGTITVIPGRAAALTVGPAPDTITADQTARLTVSGTDSDGNVTVDLGMLDWAVDVTVSGSFSPNHTAGADTVQFVPLQAGTGFITVSSSYGASAMTGLTVLPGSVDSIAIVDTAGLPVGSTSLTTDDHIRLYAAGYDSLGNPVGPTAVVWDAGGLGISIPAAGESTVVDFTTPGTGYITARYGVSATAAAGPFTVSAGSAASIVLTAAKDTVTAGDTLALNTAVYDADGNPVPPGGSCLFTCNDTDAGHFVPDTSLNGMAVFIPERSGTWRIAVRRLPENLADTVLIVSVPGPVHQIEIVDTAGREVDTLRLTTDDDGHLFYAAGYDRFGNYAGRASVTWNIGSTGTVTAAAAGSTGLTLHHTGTDRLTAVYPGGIVDSTGPVYVAAGHAAGFMVSVARDTAVPGDTVALRVDAFDADGCFTTDLGTCRWQASGTGSVMFDPETTVAGTVLALAGSIGTVHLEVRSISYGITAAGTLVIAPTHRLAMAGAVTGDRNGDGYLDLFRITLNRKPGTDGIVSGPDGFAVAATGGGNNLLTVDSVRYGSADSSVLLYVTNSGAAAATDRRRLRQDTGERPFITYDGSGSVRDQYGFGCLPGQVRPLDRAAPALAKAEYDMGGTRLDVSDDILRIWLSEPVPDSVWNGASAGSFFAAAGVLRLGDAVLTTGVSPGDSILKIRMGTGSTPAVPDDDSLKIISGGICDMSGNHTGRNRPIVVTLAPGSGMFIECSAVAGTVAAGSALGPLALRLVDHRGAVSAFTGAVKIDWQLATADSTTDAPDGSPAVLPGTTQVFTGGICEEDSLSGRLVPVRAAYHYLYVLAVVPGFNACRSTTVPFTVTDGPVAELYLIPDSTVCRSGDGVVISASSADAFGNTRNVTGEPDLVWQAPGSRTPVTNGTYFADTTGIYPVSAAWHGTADTCVVTVLPGTMTGLSLTPHAAVLTTDSVLTFRATARDGAGNLWDVSDTAAGTAWGTDDTLGTLLAGVYTPAGTGSFRIWAAHGGHADTAWAAVGVGVPAALDISPSVLTLTAGDTSNAVAVTARDGAGNTWSAGAAAVLTPYPADGITITGGRICAFTSSRTYIITVQYMHLTDTLRVTVVPAGPEYLSITAPAADLKVYGGHDVSAAVTVQDAWGNPVADGTPVIWEWFDPDMPGNNAGGIPETADSVSFTAGGTAAAVFTVPGHPGNDYRLRAHVPGFPAAVDTGPRILVVMSAICSLAVVPADTAVTADDTLQFTLRAYGVAGDSGEITAAAAWSVSDPAGRLTAPGRYVPGRSGAWLVFADIGSLQTTAGVTVLPGKTVSIRLVDGPGINAAPLTDADIMAGDTITVYAAGYDRQGNRTGLVDVIWDGWESSRLSPLPAERFTAATGTVTRVTVFTAGRYLLHGSTAGGMHDTTGIITVRHHDAPDHYRVTVFPPYPDGGTAVACTVAVYDRYGNLMTGYRANRYPVRILAAAPDGTPFTGQVEYFADLIDPAGILPAGSAFTDGITMVFIRCPKTETPLVFTFTEDSSGVTGTSGPVWWEQRDLLAGFYPWPSPVDFTRRSVMHLRYALREDCRVRISIYSTLGSFIWEKDIAPGRPGACRGANRLAWDGRNRQHKDVGSGSYMVRIRVETDGQTVEERVKIGVVGRKNIR